MLNGLPECNMAEMSGKLNTVQNINGELGGTVGPEVKPTGMNNSLFDFFL